MSIKLIPTSQYTIEQLTELYNLTRVDYLVPMPMSPEVLAEYIHDFDVDLDHSYVGLDETGKVVGLGMLGVRKGMSWVTRLGVLPSIRRRGTGRVILDALLAASREIGVPQVILEVIKDNTPAKRLFESTGFKHIEEYLVLRRAPVVPSDEPQGKISWLFRKDVLARLLDYPARLTWINAIESMENGSNLQGFRLRLPDGSAGWLVYRHKRFSLTHLVLFTEKGDPVPVAKNLLNYLHRQYRRQDTYAENILLNDSHVPAFMDLGYFEAFRRIEMILDL